MKIDIRGPTCLAWLAWFAACGSPDAILARDDVVVHVHAGR